jgi:hypothetical protein
MVLQVLPSCLGSALRELAVAKPVNHADESVSFPLLDDEGIAVLRQETIGSRGDSEDEVTGREAVRLGPDPTLADEAEARARA